MINPVPISGKEARENVIKFNENILNEYNKIHKERIQTYRLDYDKIKNYEKKCRNKSVRFEAYIIYSDKFENISGNVMFLKELSPRGIPIYTKDEKEALILTDKESMFKIKYFIRSQMKYHSSLSNLENTIECDHWYTFRNKFKIDQILNGRVIYKKNKKTHYKI